MDRKAFVRREEFEAIASGWGSDTHADLVARIELIQEFATRNGDLNMAEGKVLTAMEMRRAKLFSREYSRA